ncbi:MAG: right-handed parallel beta-helix repeat-containing protein [Thermoplasmata archaeon]|nr:right-handed parallel beta-helix repeat-containing protein [Thermoplasmata archaeon]
MKKALLALVTVLLVFSIFGSGKGEVVVPKNLTPHSPIHISSDADFNASNGVSGGSGTAADPYIISDLEIDAQGGAFGIYVEFTNAHFRIVNCTVYNATKCVISPYGCGIAFNSVSNGTITSCTVYANKYNGIWVRGSTLVNISGNYVHHNTQNGVLIANSDGILVTGNNVVDNGEAGILLQNALNITVTNNTLSKNDIQISGDAANYWAAHTIDSNLVNGKPAVYIKSQSGLTLNADYGQIIIANSTSINVSSITIKNASIAVQIGFSSDIKITTSRLTENKLYGIYTYKSTNLDIMNCTITSNGKHGLFADGSTALAIHQCYVGGNGENGIHLMETLESRITENQFVANSQYGVYITFGSISNEIHHNDFTGNNGATGTYDANHTQAYDSTGGNSWCPDNYGNYWADWMTPDADNNFVVDSPYQLDGTAGVKDDFPLVSQHNFIWIYHTPIKYAEENSEIKVNAVVHTIAAVSGVELKYLPLQGGQYLSIQMSRVSGNSTDGTYEGTIPVQSGTGYLKYYIAASVPSASMRTPVYVCIVGELVMSVNLSLSHTQISPGGTTTVMVSVKDASTQAVLGGAEVILGAMNLAGSFDKQAGYTDSNGIFVANFTADSGSTGSTGKILANVSAGGYKPGSAEVSLTITSAAGTPSAPTNLAATPGDQKVTLTWQPPANDGGSPVTDYKVYWGTISGSYTNSQNTGNQLTFTVTGLTNGQTYYFAVSAINAVGEGAKSPEVSATPTGGQQQLYNLTVTISLSKTQITAGNSTTVTVLVKNASSGGAVTNALVSLSADGVPGTFEHPSGYTGSNGEFITNFTAGDVSENTTGKIVANASAGGYNPASVQKFITVYPSWISLHTMNVNVEVSSAEVKAGETIAITVTVTDENGQPVSGVNASIELIPVAGTLDAPAKTTDNSGRATFAFTGKADLEKDTLVTVKVKATKPGYSDAEKSATISVKKKVEPKPTPGFEFLLLGAAIVTGTIYFARKKLQ